MMFNGGENEISNENIENIYSQLTNVVYGKNEIKTSIALKSEELSKNQYEIEELENALHDIRTKISSNPILKELNVSCEENAISQRKSAESIYSELPEISSKLDLHDESFAKFNKELTEIEKLHSSVKEKFQDHIGKLTLSLETEQNRNDELKADIKQNIFSKYQALIDEAALLSVNLTEERDNMKSLSLLRASKLIMLQKLKEMNEQNSELLINIDNLETIDKDISALENTVEELGSEISQLVERKTLSEDKVKEFEQEIINYKTSQTKLSEILTKHKLLSDRKATLSSINILKTSLEEKNKEFSVSRENELILEKSSSENKTELEQFKFESNKMFEEIDELIMKGELLLEEEGILLSSNNDLKEKLKILTQAISNIRKYKNELEITLNVNNEKQTVLLDEINKLEENIRQTGTVIEGLNEEIINLQANISDKEKGEETPAYGEIEKENEILDIKIRKYVKAIEIFKINRAAAMRKKKTYNDSSDSEDSMLVSNKKRS